MRCVGFVAAALLPNCGAAESAGESGSDYSQYMSQYAGGESGSDYSQYMNQYAGGQGDYSKYMEQYGDYSKYMSSGSGQGSPTGNYSQYMQQYGDYSKYMQQYGDYSKYMGGSEHQNASETMLSAQPPNNRSPDGQDDYSKYMELYGNYSEYMSSGSGQGSSAGNFDYSQYVQQWEGASSNSTEQSGFQSWMAEYLPPGDGNMYVDKWTAQWSNQTSGFEELYSKGTNGYGSYVKRYSSMAGEHPSSPEDWQHKGAEQSDAYQAAVGDSIGEGNWSNAESELAEAQPTGSSVEGLPTQDGTAESELVEAQAAGSSLAGLPTQEDYSNYMEQGLPTMAVAGMSLLVALAFVHRARKARRVAAPEATRSLLVEHMA